MKYFRLYYYCKYEKDDNYGCIYNIEDERVKKRLIKANLNSYIKDKNIYLYVNENTMSSAEFIFARALKVSESCVIIGRETFGFSGQAKQIVLAPDLVLTVTVKRYIDRMTSKEIKQGIKPDYYVTSDFVEEDHFKKYYEKTKELIESRK